jgi:hypothetical protein
MSPFSVQKELEARLGPNPMLPVSVQLGLVKVLWEQEHDMTEEDLRFLVPDRRDGKT